MTSHTAYATHTAYAILLWASLYMMDIEGLTTGPFSDMMQTMMGDV